MPLAKLAVLMFRMMGPIGLKPAFVGAIANADDHLLRGMAQRVFGFPAIAMTFAIAIGHKKRCEAMVAPD